uniref:Secreted protein n=1 Tax=Cacopsylla melanoneura TaxID=428564 RepID=A0A8D8VR16_9HEMI
MRGKCRLVRTLVLMITTTSYTPLGISSTKQGRSQFVTRSPTSVQCSTSARTSCVGSCYPVKRKTCYSAKPPKYVRPYRSLLPSIVNAPTQRLLRSSHPR